MDFLSRWLARLPFWLAVVTATVLLLLIVGAPLIDAGARISDGPGRILALFSRDVAVRRTALASALGLYVTAGVFFRPIEILARKRRSLAP